MDTTWTLRLRAMGFVCHLSNKKTLHSCKALVIIIIENAKNYLLTEGCFYNAALLKIFYIIFFALVSQCSFVFISFMLRDSPLLCILLLRKCRRPEADILI
jgi:hypothetical protein